MNRYFYAITIFTLIFASEVFANTLSSYRMGEHDSYTRIVFELSQKPKYSIMKNGKSVVIKIRDLQWKARAKKLYSPIVFVRYRGDKITLSLENTAKIRHNISPPKNGKYRLVVDISKNSFPVPKFKPAPYGIAETPTQIRTTRKITKDKNGKIIPIPVFKPRARKSPKKPVIIIDAGHGGVDPGAISVSRKKEKKIVLAYAKKLKSAINRTGRFRAILTRENDRFIKLRDRIKISHKYKGDLFISIHADSSSNPHARGLSVYTLSKKASDKESELLAARENKADIIMGVDLSHQDEQVTDILIDLAQRETQNKSTHFAKVMISKCKRKINLLSDPHRSAGFAVLKAPDTPSVLVEVGFLSNRKDNRLLQNASHRDKVAKCFVKSIEKYFKSYGI